ncbi:hypothetical protein C9374_002562 [Naegleria lovaniensis]|uniref:Uncharacterized protein n=1 Tax=Naegleria lovaniensis TaxID=51637 RepID=A0AA88GPS8_NAELO|nr:uncharacterized protein C9374_002562 [Naegleria lovaniensis]KAG2386116.1 hypothetical protein C9374_002562 [Naegleria lovaniensis]
MSSTTEVEATTVDGYTITSSTGMDDGLNTSISVGLDGPPSLQNFIEHDEITTIRDLSPIVLEGGENNANEHLNNFVRTPSSLNSSRVSSDQVFDRDSSSLNDDDHHEIRREVMNSIAGLISARKATEVSFSEELEKRLDFQQATRSISLLDQIAQEEFNRQNRMKKQNMLLEGGGGNIEDIIARELDQEIEELNSLSNELANTRLFAESISEQEANYESILGRMDIVLDENSPIPSSRYSQSDQVETQLSEEKADEEYEHKRKIGSAHATSRRRKNRGSNAADSAPVHSGVDAFLERCDNFSFFNFPVLSIIEKFNQKNLDLSHLTLGDKGVQAISSMLRLNNVIQKLTLADNNISSVGFADLVTSLRKNTTLKHLDISDNKLGLVNSGNIDMPVMNTPSSSEGSRTENGNSSNTTPTSGSIESQDACSQAMLNLLKKNGVLESFIARDNHLTDQHLKYIVEGLNDNITLTCLDISSNDFTDNSGQILGHLLATTRLRHLDLSWTSLRKQGISNMLLGLKTNNSLVELNLSWIGLNNDHCKLLSQFIAESDALCVLNISHNRFDEEGLQPISKALEQNTSLTHLDLSYNTLGNNAVMSLFRCLHKHHHVKWLNLVQTNLNVMIDKNALTSETTLQPVFLQQPEKQPQPQATKGTKQQGTAKKQGTTSSNTAM